jgi:hypothetical protein
MAIPVLPCFLRHQDEASIIGRLLAGYGELEMDLALTVGHIIGDMTTAFKVMFRTRGESQRIELADALGRLKQPEGRERTMFEEAIAGMKFCVQIRNQYAHCHWIDDPSYGLMFTNMEEQATKHTPWIQMRLKRYVAELSLLKQQEAFFIYVEQCLQYLNMQAQVRAGGLSNHTIPIPTKVTRPPLHN